MSFSPRISQSSLHPEPIDQDVPEALVPELSVERLIGGTITGQVIAVGDDGVIKAGYGSTTVELVKEGLFGYVDDRAVFALDKDGLRVTGHIEAESGTFSGLVTGGSINLGNGTFTVDEQGNMVASSAVIGGLLLREDGTFVRVDEVAEAGANAAQASEDAAIALAAAERAQTTTDAAVTASAINLNPHFGDWFEFAVPDHWGQFVGGPPKELTQFRSPPWAVRFPIGTATDQKGIYANDDPGPQDGLRDLPLGTEYVVVETDVMLLSGTFTGSGILFHWTGQKSSGAAFHYRNTTRFDTELAGAQPGRWYRLSKVIRRPTPEAGWTQLGHAVYLMGNWTNVVGESTLGGGAVKDIIFDRCVVRPATAEEITAITALSTAQTKAQIHTSATAPTGLTAANDGDLWVDTDEYGKTYRWTNLAPVLRTNLVPNPHVYDLRGWAGNPGNGGVATYQKLFNGPNIGTTDVSSFMRMTWTTGQTTIFGGPRFDGRRTSAIPMLVQGSTTYRASLWGRTSKNQNMAVVAYFYDALGQDVTPGQTGYIGTVQASGVNTWKRYVLPSVIAPAEAAYALVAFYVQASGSTLWAAQDWCDATAVIMERHQSGNVSTMPVGEAPISSNDFYFDGSSSVYPAAYWDGEVGASTSSYWDTRVLTQHEWVPLIDNTVLTSSMFRTAEAGRRIVMRTTQATTYGTRSTQSTGVIEFFGGRGAPGGLIYTEDEDILQNNGTYGSSRGNNLAIKGAPHTGVLEVPEINVGTVNVATSGMLYKPEIRLKAEDGRIFVDGRADGRVAGGVVAYNTRNTNQTGLTATVVRLASIAFGARCYPGRVYKWQFRSRSQGNTANNSIGLVGRISPQSATAAVTDFAAWTVSAVHFAANTNHELFGQGIFQVPDEGNYIFSVWGSLTGGTGTVGVFSTGMGFWEHWLEDVGGQDTLAYNDVGTIMPRVYA